MNKDEFEKLGLDWQKLNEEYDHRIQQFFSDPTSVSFTAQQIEDLKGMQHALYALEAQWFSIVTGETTIEE